MSSAALRRSAQKYVRFFPLETRVDETKNKETIKHKNQERYGFRKLEIGRDMDS